MVEVNGLEGSGEKIGSSEERAEPKLEGRNRREGKKPVTRHFSTPE